MIPPLEGEGVPARPLARGAVPRRLVLLRLHAFGDSLALLPLLSGLSERYPGCRLEVVTGPESAELFRARPDVAAVHVLDARAPRVARYLSAIRLAGRLRREPLDALLDLQRSRLTRLLRLAARPPAYAVLDRFAPRHGLERFFEAAQACGLGELPRVFSPRIQSEVVARARGLLRDSGWDPARPLVLLNPAGGWETKEWPLERWEALGRSLAGGGVQVLLLGAGAAAARVGALGHALGGLAIDLVGRTTPSGAMALVAECAAAVSEDSGLMHLAWTQGVPTIALFGSSRAVWARPLSPGSSGFYSEDLACGACMSPSCARGDLLCLARVSVEMVLERVLAAAPRRSG